MGVKNLNFTRSDESILSLYDVIILEKCNIISKNIMNTYTNDLLNVFEENDMVDDDVDDLFTNKFSTTNAKNTTNVKVPRTPPLTPPEALISRKQLSSPPPSPPYSSTMNDVSLDEEFDF